jgi:hypothetical protein
VSSGSSGNQTHMVTEKMIFCNHYSNCRLLLTPVILTLYLTLSISSSCTLVLIDYDFRCSTSLDMSTVSISYMVNANIDIFEISYDESVSYFKCLENLETIRRNNGPNHSSLPVDNKKTVSVTSSIAKSSKNHKGSHLRCHYYESNNHNTADCRAISKFKQ